MAGIVLPVVMARRVSRPGPVAVAGLLRSTTGLGQGARLCLAALQKVGYETRSLDLGRFLYWHSGVTVELGREMMPGEGGQIIIHLNPLELALVLPFLGRRLLKDKKIIGYWAWELENIPEVWKPAMRLVDEIWTPSHFVAEAVRRDTKIPVHVVHHPVWYPNLSGRSRESFGIPSNCFVVLSMFDMRSSAERKNPIGAVRAFRMAFGDRSDVRMIVKVGSAKESPKTVNQLRKTIADARNVTLVFDTLQPEDQAALIDCADVVISLHRSEGFGLVLAEAMYLGKPVIATGYSGNLDFMDRANSILIGYKMVPIIDPQKIYTRRNQMWAEPDVEEAAEWLKRLADDPDLRADIGRQARESVQRYFSLDSFKRAINATGLMPPA